MNNTENYIYHLCKSINILNYDQLSIDSISTILDINILYWEYSSELVCFKDKHKMFINEQLTLQEQWQDFGHEMYHYFFDETSYSLLNESYGAYGESKADYFMYHFCIPTFMLMELKGVNVYDVMNLFNVEFEFALRRLEMYRNNVLTKKGVFYG